MLRRMTYIENQRVLADSGVITSPLNVRDPITALDFEIRVTNSNTWNNANTVAENIQAIELLDGSNVIFSISGAQALAYGCYHTGHFPLMNIVEGPNQQATLEFSYQFGRWFGDTVYALDPSKFANLVLRLTWNWATIAPVAPGGFATNTGLYTVIAEVMEGAPAPQGLLATRQHYQFVTAAAGTTFIDLPVDRRLKSILLRSAAVAFGGIVGIGRVKVTCDQDKFIPFDMTRTDLYRYMAQRNPNFFYKHFFMAKDGDTLYPLLKREEDVQLQGFQGDDTYTYTNGGNGFGVFGQLLAGVADANMRSYIGHVSGIAPMNTAMIDLGEWDDPASWLDPSTFKSIQLQLSNNAALAVATVVLESELVY